MGEIIKLNVNPQFETITQMLNQWWKELDRKPFSAKPVRIRHLVETAHAAGWTINECYAALDVTWGFTESAFETALRLLADEGAARGDKYSNIATIEETHKAMQLTREGSLSRNENIEQLQKLRRPK